ncbi:MAG: hypothetical protein RR482_06115 [Clostridia bacterium]
MYQHCRTRLYALTLALLLCLSAPAFAAVGEQGETERLNPFGVYPIAKERTPLSVMMAQNVLVVILASGQTLPDVVSVGMSISDDYLYGSAGTFLDLTELYQTQAYYIPQQLAAHPEVEVMRYITAPDGKIYNIPRYQYEVIGPAGRKCYINQDWLDKLGLAQPTNTEEFYQVLKAFAEKDPNGNGKADEIAMVGSTGWGQSPIPWLMNAFIYDDDEDNFFVSDGRLDVNYRHEAYREGLRYIHKLVKEGLLSSLSFTQTMDQLKQLCASEDAATVGCVSTFATSMMLPTGHAYNQYYVGLAPIAGPEGNRTAMYAPTLPNNVWHLTRDCRNPELAFRVGDFLWQSESYLRGRYGVEGQDWYKNEDMTKPAVIAGYKPLFYYPKSIWNDTQNSHLHNEHPCFDVTYLNSWVLDLEKTPYNTTYTAGLIAPAYAECFPAEGTYVPVLFYTPEETEEVSEIRATLKSYVTESSTRFVVGDLDLDKDWDAFQTEIEAIGLSRFLEISQAAYDRMYR